MLLIKEPGHPLQSFVVPGAEGAVYAFAVRLTAIAAREGRQERYEIEAPGQPAAVFDAVEVKPLFDLFGTDR